jgi:3-hydroxyisobutyrate dehydrogenase
MLKLAYVGGLGLMAGPASIHLTPQETAQVLRVHDRGTPGKQRDSFRAAWREHGAELVPDFDRLVGPGEIDGVVVCAGKNGDDLPLIAQLARLLQARCQSRPFILHLSTVSPAFALNASSFCQNSQVDYANYPLTGGPLGAMLGGADAKGMLILASGPEALYQRLLPMLRKLGHPRYFGASDSAGAVTKLIGQHLVFNGLNGVTAAAALHSAFFNEGKLGGDEQADYLSFLNGGAGGTRQWDVALKKGVAEGVWDAGFNIRHAVVDAIYAAQLAIDNGLPRFAIQSIINTAFAFSFVLERYPQQSLATHAIAREMLGSSAVELDRFMEDNAAFAANPGDSLAACIDSLPEQVRESVVLEPLPAYFEDEAAKAR